MGQRRFRCCAFSSLLSKSCLFAQGPGAMRLFAMPRFVRSVCFLPLPSANSQSFCLHGRDRENSKALSMGTGASWRSWTWCDEPGSDSDETVEACSYNVQSGCRLVVTMFYRCIGLSHPHRVAERRPFNGSSIPGEPETCTARVDPYIELPPNPFMSFSLLSKRSKDRP